MDIDDQREAVDEASKQLSTLVLASLLAAIYVAIALAQLRDADYLNGLGQRLPILDATVPANAFLILAPALILVLHLALLVQWNLYRRRVRAFVAELKPNERDDQLRTLYSFLLVLCLIPKSHAGRTRWLAGTLVAFGLIVAPLMLLVVVQVRSLSFHDHLLTGLHRAFVIADLIAILVYFLPKWAEPHAKVAWGAGVTLMLVFAWYSNFDAVVPGENVEQIPEKRNITDRWFRERRLYLRGAVLEPRGEGSSTEKVAPQARLDLQCRDMRFADLTDATLIRPALYGATLRGAILNQARFVDTKLDSFLSKSERERRGCTVVDETEEGKACPGPRVDFRFVWASQSSFNGQDLSSADFTGATLLGSKFIGSNLTCASMEAASLDSANLMAARLFKANLRLASLNRADLSFANLGYADLTAADLRSTRLWRNPLFSAKWHLADLSLSSSIEPEPEQLATMREVLANAQETRPGEPPSLETIDTLSATGLELGTHKFRFGIPACDALFLKYDYLSIPKGSLPEPLSGTDFRDLLWAFLENEKQKRRELATALARRGPNEQLFVPLAMMRDQLPHVSPPNEPSIDVVRGESEDVGTLWEKTDAGNRAKIEARNISFVADDTRPKKLAWMQALDDALQADDVAKQKASDIAKQKALVIAKQRALRTALWDAAQGGDALALALLPRLLSARPELRDDKIARWLIEQSETNKSVDATGLVAIAALMDEGVAQTSLLLRAAPNYAVAAEELGRRGHDEWTEVAANKWQVEAQFFQGFKRYTDETASENERTLAWQRLTRAAYRGHVLAQYEVGSLMKEEGDYAGAALWLGRAAASGAPRFENDFAWFLATCPVASFRDPARALSLSMEAVRRSKSARTSSSSQDPEGIALEDALDTLAAAYAATGDFAGAIDAQTKALAMIRKGKNKSSIAEAESRLASYKSRNAWIEH